MGVLIISLLKIVGLVSVEGKRVHSNMYCLNVSFNLRRLWPLSGIHTVRYDDNQTTPPKSQSSHSRYGLWFQKSSLIMSQCCSSILVDSCLVLWFPRILGSATSSSDPMETPFCLRYWRIDKRFRAMNVPMWGSHMSLFRTYLQGKLHSHRSRHLRADP
jgi:hypothetical protein